jgi:O-antigen/teichoic acid export membrane protein
MFVLTRRLVDVFRLFVERQASAASPVVSYKMGHGPADTTQSLVLLLLVVAIWGSGILASFVICLNSRLIELWIGPNIFAGELVNTVQVVAALGGISATVLTILTQAAGEFKKSSLITGIVGTINIAAAILGIEYFGLLGLAGAHLPGAILLTLYLLKVTHESGVMTREGLIQLARECLIAIGVMIAISTMFINQPGGSWMDLGRTGMWMGICWIFAVLIGSRCIRIELRKLLQTFR